MRWLSLRRLHHLQAATALPVFTGIHPPLLEIMIFVDDVFNNFFAYSNP